MRASSKKARSKTHAVCESVLKSMRNVRKRATFFNFLLVFSIFFDFFIFFEGVYADLIARVKGSIGCLGGGRSWQGPVEKILKIPIFGAEGDADLIENRGEGEAMGVISGN